MATMEVVLLQSNSNMNVSVRPDARRVAGKKVLRRGVGWVTLISLSAYVFSSHVENQIKGGYYLGPALAISIPG